MKKRILLLFLLVSVSKLFSQTIDPLRTLDAGKQEIWVDSIMNTMTIDEKIGQLFMVQAYSNLDEKHETFISEMITKYHVGSLIFMQGTPEKQAVLNNEYQALAKVPLMIGFDGEWGLDMRLKNTYKFPWNMTLGAIQNDSLIQQFGEHLGKHCKRLGIHINFAPVVDINVNPENPIIGNRSFGESKENVTQKAIAFTKGMQSQGVLANAKHFPGHGDTDTDSHLDLPWVRKAEVELQACEWVPFMKAIESGVPKLKIEEAAAIKQAKIDRGEHTIVGVNKYKVENDEEIEILEIDNTAVRESQIKRLAELKKGRDDEKVTN